MVAASATEAPSGTLLLTDREVATELRIGLTKTRRLIRERKIPSLKIDGHRRVRRHALEAYVAQLEAVNAGQVAS